MTCIVHGYYSGEAPMSCEFKTGLVYVAAVPTFNLNYNGKILVHLLAPPTIFQKESLAACPWEAWELQAHAEFGANTRSRGMTFPGGLMLSCVCHPPPPLLSLGVHNAS